MQECEGVEGEGCGDEEKLYQNNYAYTHIPTLMRSNASSPFSTIFPPSPSLSTCVVVLTGGGGDSTACLVFRLLFLPFFEMWGEGNGPVALRGERARGKGKDRWRGGERRERKVRRERKERGEERGGRREEGGERREEGGERREERGGEDGEEGKGEGGRGGRL